MSDFFGWLIIIGFVFLWAFGVRGIRYVVHYSKGIAKAAYATHKKEGTFQENLKFQIKGMGEFRTQGISTVYGDPGSQINAYDIQARGLFPVSADCECKYLTSLFDITDEKNWSAIVCTVNDFQEPQTTCYSFTVGAGVLRAGYGFKNWVRIGAVAPSMLRAPVRGKRKLRALVRLVNASNPPEIKHGFHATESQDRIYWTGSYDFDFEQVEPGWLDAQNAARECAAVTVQIAIAFATVDGALDDKKGFLITDWMKRKVSPYSGAPAEAWKTELNAAFKTAFNAASKNSLRYSDLTKVLLEKGTPSIRLECVDLLYSIVGSDGRIDAQEMALARQIAVALEVDPDELKRISDSKLVGARTSVKSQSDLEALLGIDKSWKMDRIKKHLRDEFQKWNNRQTSLADPGEQQNAAQMLRLIAEARKKYS
jgi:tellurite resistance protein